MAIFQQSKQNIGHAWEHLAEGGDSLTRKATNAITHFTSSDNKDKHSDEEYKELTNRNIGWGVMATELFDNDRVIVRLEAPGMDKKEFDRQVIDDVLIVRGEKRIQRGHTEGHYR